jgi:hypothetical protein
MIKDFTIFGLDFHFHKWIDIQRKAQCSFLGETYSEYANSGYRICDKCMEVREYFFDSQGGSWNILSPKQTEIIFNKIYKKNNQWYFKQDAFDYKNPQNSRPKPSSTSTN